MVWQLLTIGWAALQSWSGFEALGTFGAWGPLCFEEIDDNAKHSTGAWRLLARPEQVTACSTKLAQFMYGWASTMAAIPQAPENLCAVAAGSKQAFSDLKALLFSVPRLPTKGEYNYVSMWTVRTHMITLMAQEGIPRLKIGPGIWTLSFCKMNRMRTNAAHACI